MWLHRFDIVSLSILLGAIICAINSIGFVSVYVCRVCDALIASCATIHNATVCVHETKLTYHVKQESGVAHSYTSSA